MGGKDQKGKLVEERGDKVKRMEKELQVQEEEEKGDIYKCRKEIHGKKNGEEIRREKERDTGLQVE